MPFQVQSNSVNTDTERAIESIRINGVSVLRRLHLEEMKGFLSPGTEQTVLDNEMSTFSGCP